MVSSIIRLLTSFILITFLIVFSASGCIAVLESQSPNSINNAQGLTTSSTLASSPSSSIPTSSQPTQTSPQNATPPSSPLSPFKVEFSFTNGAPPLNQAKEFDCIIKSNYASISNMSLKVNLPDAFELVSGNLSWYGDIQVNSTVTAIKVIIKATKIGNWTIGVTSYLNPQEHGGTGGTGNYPIYVSILSESARWGIFPPWNRR